MSPHVHETTMSGQSSANASQILVPEPKLSHLNRIGVALTEKFGSMGFVLIVLVWTILWCGYNILASEVKSLHWKAFDPFPAFVAYLLICVVIQMFLMPLILVKQNLQAKHDDARAEFDFQTNLKAEKNICKVLEQLDRRNAVLLELVNQQSRNVDKLASATEETPRRNGSQSSL
jgi:uncharacterized membrane protein